MDSFRIDEKEKRTDKEPVHKFLSKSKKKKAFVVVYKCNFLEFTIVNLEIRIL